LRGKGGDAFIKQGKAFKEKISAGCPKCVIEGHGRVKRGGDCENFNHRKANDLCVVKPS